MRFRSVVLAFAIAAVSSLATWQWAAAQDPDLGVATARGPDIMFRPDREQRGGLMGERSVRGKLYVRMGSQWVLIELTNNDGAYLLPLKP